MIKFDCVYSNTVHKLEDWDDVDEGFATSPERSEYDERFKWMGYVNPILGHKDRDMNLYANKLKFSINTYDAMDMCELFENDKTLEDGIKLAQWGRLSVEICEKIDFGKIIISCDDIAVGEINIINIPNCAN